MIKPEYSESDKITSEPNMFEYSKIFWDRRRPVAYSIIIASILAVILSLLLPKTYRASAVLMPPIQNQGSGILNSLTSLPFGGLLSQATDETMSFIAILKSRTVMEEVVNKFDLINVYEAENMEEAVRALSGNVFFMIEDEGTIVISANASTSWFHPDEEEELAKVLCADMANYFVEQLDVVGKGLKSQQASFRRKFIERRYNKNIEDLMKAEDSLKNFQQDQNMIALNEQTRAAIEIAAAIKGQILANEVQLGVMQTTLNPDHPEMKRIQKETEELKLQLLEMDYGTNSGHNRTDNLFPAFSDVPDLGIQLMRLTRSVEIQNTLFTFLTQQYEEAKIQEARDTPTIQVLDEAVVPVKKYRPRRMLFVVSIFLLTILMNIVYVIVRTNYNKLPS